MSDHPETMETFADYNAKLSRPSETIIKTGDQADSLRELMYQMLRNAKNEVQ